MGHTGDVVHLGAPIGSEISISRPSSEAQAFGQHKHASLLAFPCLQSSYHEEKHKKKNFAKNI